MIHEFVLVNFFFNFFCGGKFREPKFFPNFEASGVKQF